MVPGYKGGIVPKSEIAPVTLAEIVVGDLDAGDQVGAAEATIRVNSIAPAGEVVIVYDDAGNGAKASQHWFEHAR